MTTIFAVVLVMAIIISASLIVILVSDIQKRDRSGEKKYLKNKESAANLKRYKPSGRYRGSMNPTHF